MTLIPHTSQATIFSRVSGRADVITPDFSELVKLDLTVFFDVDRWLPLGTL